ncbi:MAG: 2-C-methyl-D-erythritol 4-phosphate cytidylyltransferase [candidate division KSB1 bacterium]|nr:2-C-methyl-D-erythritol 4-phosphate cytidylyltransferase [candidate division KSB1 bacterium]MDZ7303093.1 2-C-methyl-D-erythritol 4-phosphate cytidylyltransferase [candidate division KSB1 bacterium]MDZ7312632.1 2-C-methyl-D-erythritol 4-phosphate cytidylyltransferase [candidate division KSB1 bacterium]
MTDIAAIVVAAGQGRRFGSDLPKQFLLLQNRPIIVHALERFERAPGISQIILVTASEWVEYCGCEIVERFHFTKVGAIVPGGKERQDSVYAGLQALPTAHDIVVVHDAVRPLFSLGLLEKVIKACATFDACVPGLPSRDTIKRIEGEHVIETVTRDTLRLVQTPQAFRCQTLLHAFEQARAANFYSTDEAALIEKFGGRVTWVEGEETNLKITTPRDLQIAELFLQEAI